MFAELTRDEANTALVEGVSDLNYGRCPLGVPGLTVLIGGRDRVGIPEPDVRLSRLEASLALVEGIRVLQRGVDPLRDSRLGVWYWMAIHQHVAPRLMNRARFSHGVDLDEGEAVDLVMERLELQVETDRVRHSKNETARATSKRPKLRPLVLPAIVEAEDPIGYLIHVATKIADRTSPREADHYPGWLQHHLVKNYGFDENHTRDRRRSFEEMVEHGVELPAGPVGSFDEAGFARLAAHTLRLVLKETPDVLHAPVTEMLEWSVAAIPQVARKHEREKDYEEHNRIRMAAELFGEILSIEQITALHNLVWGPAEHGGERSSLVVHVATVRRAHFAGKHDWESVVGKIVRDEPSKCHECSDAPLSGDTLRALVITYADKMRRSVQTAD
ncbi:hypothetical protein [Leifsonia aquatica]|uniref:hypothetical protein n=1 Tax=Leifsonia aquatica TaxID=144185 RepID=UPI0038192BFB